MRRDKIITSTAIIYFIIGLLFATAFAIYYKWSFLSLFSPGFYAVVLSWPFQAVGLIKDLTYYGLAGKPI